LDAVGAPGTPPSIADAPPPMQGAPLSGFVPTAMLGAVVPGSAPGVVGDTGVSGCCGKVSELDGFVVMAGEGTVWARLTVAASTDKPMQAATSKFVRMSCPTPNPSLLPTCRDRIAASDERLTGKQTPP
jgi:hypothetical protein